jgi:hypothetical protein
MRQMFNRKNKFANVQDKAPKLKEVLVMLLLNKRSHRWACFSFYSEKEIVYINIRIKLEKILINSTIRVSFTGKRPAS